ncbi:MAG: TetR/AcrR family transcriptional regulator [Chloroflexota bacterium]
MSARREEILLEAARVFQEKGYRGTTVQDIAEAVGMLKGSLYYHFANKEEIFYEIVHDPLYHFVSQMAEVVALDLGAAEKLCTALRYHLSAFDAHLPGVQVLLRENLDTMDGQRWAVIQALWREHRELWETILRQGMESGAFRPDLDVKVVTLGILGMCNWMHRWYHQDGRLTSQQIADIWAAMVLDGISR